MKNILVTGATGFVGERLIPRLLQEGFRLRIATRSPQKANPNTETVVIEDINEHTSWEKALQDIDVVIHLAALTHAVKNGHYENISLETFESINVKGTKTLAMASAKAGVKQFIYLSSIKAVGERTKRHHPFTEDSHESPEDFYGKTKLFAEKELKKVSYDTHLAFTIVRSPLIYGPGVKGNFLSLLKLCDTGIPLPLDSIDNKRSFLFVDNLVDGIIKCIGHNKAYNQTFHISDTALSTSDLIKTIRQGLHRPARLFNIGSWFLMKLLYLSGRKTFSDRLLGSLEVDSSRIQKLLRWKPPFSTEEGLKITITCYCQRQKSANN